MENTCERHAFGLQNLLFLLFSCLFIVIPIYPVIGDSNVTPYDPIENIAIDCGSANNGQSQDNKRSWISDSNGKFKPIEQHNNNNKSSESKSASQRNPSLDTVPYQTARLSYSEFTYSIPLTSGPKFVRMHFYPVGFDNRSNIKAFFSVKAGNYTLLSNFSALLHAGNEPSLVKEFCVNVDEGQMLNLTFTPSAVIPASYAFINGIEVVSMPINLYYGAPIDDDRVPFLGMGDGSIFNLENSTALEMVHRVNVGGSQISEVDTGMFRSWKDDIDYMTIAKPSALPVNSSINLTFRIDVPSFSAPREVYITARTMGLNKTENENYKLTWDFLVDPGFKYFVRLHFCEFQPEITKEGNRVFQIFIADLMAEDQADVILWSGGNGVPVYKDYVVAIGKLGNQKQRNLSIALHPAPEWRTNFSDAILNGLEIFKISNYHDLAGPNPDPVPVNATSKNSTPGSTKSKNNNKTVIGIVGGVIAGLVVISLLCFLIFRRRMRVKDPNSGEGVSLWSQFSTTTKSTKSTKSHGSSLPSDLCRYFSLAEIKGATNNFNSVFIIGVGGFGNVYKGSIDGGATQVAIKRLNPESQQGAHEFKTEIEMLSQLRHLHLVSLIGYCNEGGEMILVYDYMAHGTLRDHLYNTENPPLPWKQRLEICLGAARGLHYLHTGAKHTIIHRDVKTTNILLDEKWVAKVSDFGLSRVGPTNMSKAHVSTVVKGSVGYLDPEYYRRQQLTEKSDVYSFGVVLCEILCARPPVIRTVEKAQVSLAAWAQECHRNGTLNKIIDPILRGEIEPECLKKFTEVTMSCLRDEGTERPSMGDVVWSLEFALQLQESDKGGELKSEDEIASEVGIDEDTHTPLKAYPFEDESAEVFSSIGDHVLNSKITTSTFSLTSEEQSFTSKDSEKLLSKAVFSEIKNPQGR